MCKLTHLAVAAALVGLATQVQAGYFPGSTDFEDDPLANTAVWPSASIGEAAITADATVESAGRATYRPSRFSTTDRENVLSVDNDIASPIVCNINGGETMPASTIYADVLIKGTPLANGASVPEFGPNDKILVYTRVNADGTDTNLCVLAKPDANSLTNEYVFTSTHIGKDEWHRIIIEAVDNGTYKVYCDAFGQNALGTYYPINGGASMSSLAFAGTGSVDDLILSDLIPEQPVTTLTWDTSFASVSYVVGNETNALTVANGSYEFQPAGAVTLIGNTGYRTFATSGSAGTEIVLAAPTGIDNYFPQTATAGQDGTAAHPFEIADVGDLLALQAAVQVTNCADICFIQVADIDFNGEAAFAGIGTYNGSKVGTIEAGDPRGGVPFAGTYNGQEYKIANVTFTDRTYAGIFNQVNGGTIQNLTVSNLTFVGTGTEYSASIVGNAGNGATLQNLVAAGSFGSSEKPGTHNMAGIVIRACGGGANGTLVSNCCNNAAIYGTYTKMAGICAITQVKVSGGPVTFDGCVNNGNLTMPSGDTAGRDGLAGIVGYVSDNTVLKDCMNTTYGDLAFSTDLATAKIGQLVGYAYDHSLTDLGGNSAFFVKKMVGEYNSACAVTNLQYATFRAGLATTVTKLARNETYMLEANIPASETPVLTLTAHGDKVVFYMVTGYTFAGTIAAAESLAIDVSTDEYTITYTAYRTGPPSFKDPEGRDIEDPTLVNWLADSGFTQADINALGNDAAATEKLHECYLLNCDFRMQDAGGSLSITDITVSTNLYITVQLVRKAPQGNGVITGKLCFYGANDLAAGFVRTPIPDENVGFLDNPTFRIYEPSDSVSQTVPAVLRNVTYKFFKAAIVPLPPEPEPDPEPEPEQEE